MKRLTLLAIGAAALALAPTAHADSFSASADTWVGMRQQLVIDGWQRPLHACRLRHLPELCDGLGTQGHRKLRADVGVGQHRQRHHHR